MAKEKPFDYHHASEGELLSRMDKTKGELFKVRFRASTAPVKNTMQIRHMRREIARLHTFINQKKTVSQGSK